MQRLVLLLFLVQPAAALGQVPEHNGKPYRHWRQQAEAKDAATRVPALRALGAMRAYWDAPVVAKALHSADWSERRVAGEVLKRLGPAALPAMLPVLATGKHEARRAVIQLLEQWRRNAGPEASHVQAALVRAAKKDLDPEVRRGALSALRRWADAKTQSAVVQVLIAALDDADSETRQKAALELGFLRPAPTAALPALQKRLEHADHPFAQIVIGTYGRVGKAAAVPALVRIASAKSPLSFAAAGALARLQLRPEVGVPVLVQALKQDPYTAAQELTAYGALAAPAVGPLRIALKTAAAGARWQLLAALRAIGPKAAAAVPDLIAMLDDPTCADLLADVCDVLGAIGPKAAPAVDRLIALVERGPRARFGALEALGRIGRPAAKAAPLLERLYLARGRDAVPVAVALARIGLPKHLDRLEQDLARPNALAPALGLARAGVRLERALPALGKLLSTKPRHGVRLSILDTLIALGPKARSLRVQVQACLKARVRDVRVMAQRALDAMGEE